MVGFLGRVRYFVGKVFWPWVRWLICHVLNLKPKYEPDRWNDPYLAGYDYGHQSKNNCYNYACNKATDSFAQPGYASGSWPNPMACAPVSAGAMADGLVVRADGSPASGGCCQTVALVVAPGYDYHWYRLDDNGWWSHKPGGTAARNVDAAFNPISDPQTAARGPYTEFCGFFTVCRYNVGIDGPY
jgi:hypothetical protein